MPSRIIHSKGILLLAAVAASAALSVAALGATLVYRAHISDEFKGHTRAQCQSIEAIKSAIRLVFQDNVDALQQRRTQMDPAQYRIAFDYYQRQLDRFKADACP